MSTRIGTPSTVALRELEVSVRCSNGICCSESDHPGVGISEIRTLPKDCNDAGAEKATAVFRAHRAMRELGGGQRTRGADIWLLEQLALIAPLVCATGGHPVDVPALTLRLAKEAVWQ